MIRPIYQPLNDAVLAISGRLFPNGFDVVHFGAPETLDDLNRDLAMNMGRLRVWSGASDDTIFGDPAVNHAFRAWHDWTHWAHQTPFTLEGERETCNAQIAWLRTEGLTHRERGWYDVCVSLLRAEVIGQAEHHAKHGRFPERQREFALAYMARMVGKDAW